MFHNADDRDMIESMNPQRAAFAFGDGTNDIYKAHYLEEDRVVDVMHELRLSSICKLRN
jgi:hypothetical protein